MILTTQMWHIVMIALVTTAAFRGSESAGPFVSNVLGSNMVLQANRPSRLWGWTTRPSSLVTVNVTSDGLKPAVVSVLSRPNDGLWIAQLPPIGYRSSPSTIVIGTNGQVQTLVNVLFGEVYMCGGQSNMEMSVSGTFNASLEIQEASKYPNIRLFTVGQGSVSKTPLDYLESVEQPWTVASPEAIGAGVWDHFSATCWYFGKRLYDKLNLPIGLVSSNWGGTYIQAWSPANVISKCKATEPPYPPAGMVPAAPPSNPANNPSYAYNAMIHPFTKMSIRGMIWYQGESNVGEAAAYACYFPAMISEYRILFAHAFWFGFVQLSPFTLYAEAKTLTLPELREAQMVATFLPSVSAITAIDAGDPTSPYGDIHPRDKKTLGVRLADAAYGTLEDGRPPSTGAKPTYANYFAGTVLVHYDLSHQLRFVNNTCPPKIDPTVCAGFQTLGSDGIWRVANPVMSGPTNTIVVSTPGVPSEIVVVAVRYAYANWPLALLYDQNGHPAYPFQLTLVD